SFYDDMIELNILSNSRKIVARLDKGYKLEPRSENLVEVILSEPVHGQCVMLEPLTAREKQKYLVARVLVQPTGKHSICRILNPTNQILNLRKHLPIANIQLIDVNSITSYDVDNINHIDGVTRTKLQTQQNKNTSKQTTLKTDKTKKTLADIGLSLDNDNLTGDQKQRLTALLQDNADLFAQSLSDLPGTNLYEYKIDTGDAAPIRQRPYRPNPQARDEI